MPASFRFLALTSVAIGVGVSGLALRSFSQDSRACQPSPPDGPKGAETTTVTALKVSSDRPRIRTRALSLEDLTKKADKIFIGKVHRVRAEDMEIEGNDGDKASVKVQAVSLKVLQRFKGNIAVGDSVVLKQLTSDFESMTEGETLLLYVSRPGRSGLTAPIGIYSGHFKVDMQRRLVANLLDNRGLWTTGIPPIESPQDFRSKWDAVLSSRHELDEDRTAGKLAVISEPYQPAPLPLELVTAATQAYLHK